MFEPEAPMVGRTCLVTGANSGIGLEIARGLAERGATVLMVARSPVRGQEARDDVVASTGNEAVEVLFYDLGSQRQVRQLASEVLDRFDQLHVLVNNAGLTLGERTMTEDGVETTFAVNHLAPFLLTELLRERLIASSPARVVTVASDAHSGSTIDFDDLSGENGYSGWQAYGQSKLANILFTNELSRRLEGTGVTATCLHPGVVSTGFGRRGPGFIRVFQKFAGVLLLSPEKGADTAIYLATSPEVEGESGGYYVKRRLKEPSRAARDPDTADRLWDVSRRLTGLATAGRSG
jgi:NAD(P)-dependent dehydrogenase (short-subunit alcohol dehydrogenase family)